MGRRSRRTMVVVLTGLLLFAPSAATAQEEPPAGPVTLAVTAGLAGYVDPDEPTIVAVDVASDVLVVADLQVRAGQQDVVRAIEVPAGGVKRFSFDVPAMGTSRQVTVSLIQDGEVVVRESTRVRVADAVLVGLLGIEGIETTLRSAVTTPLERAIEPVPIVLDDLQAALRVLPYLVVGEGAALDEPAIKSMTRWVNAGGKLYAPRAVGERITEIAGAEPVPGSGVAAVRLGDGEVGVLDDAPGLGAGEWSALVRDVPLDGFIQSFVNEEVDFALLSAATSGREANVPALPWLLAGIVVFVLLVGPANFLVLRSLGKPEAAWITVPVLSAVFVTGFWFVGRGQVQDFSIGHASVVVQDGADVSSAAAGFVLQTETGGDHRLALPRGHRPFPFRGGAIASPSGIDQAAEAAFVTFELDDLGVGAVQSLWEPDPVDVSLAVTADGAQITVEATNDGSQPFWAWGAVVGGRAYYSREVLEPGASGSVTGAAPRFIGSAYDPVIAVGIFNTSTVDLQSRYDVVGSLARYAEWMAKDLRDTEVYFFGFTDDYTIDVEVDGSAATATGTALQVKRAELDDEARLALGRARPELLAVTGASNVEAYYGEIYAYGAREIFFRYILPDAAPGIVEIRPGFTQLDVVEAFDWAAGEFVAIEWNREFGLERFVSASGELVLRTAVDSDQQFFDESLQTDRFAIIWSTA